MQHFNMGSLELEGEITDLERKLIQRDETTNCGKMKSEMETASTKGELNNANNCFLFVISNNCTHTLYFIIVLIQLTSTVLE